MRLSYCHSLPVTINQSQKMFIPSYSSKYLRQSLKYIGIIGLRDIHSFKQDLLMITSLQLHHLWTFSTRMSSFLSWSFKIFIAVVLPQCQSISLPVSLSQYTFLLNGRYLAFETPWLIKENLWLAADLGMHAVNKAVFPSGFLTDYLKLFDSI